MPHAVPPSSTASSVDAIPPTPGSESEKDYTFSAHSTSGGSARRESESSVSAAGLGLGLEESKKEETKRAGETAGEAPKKKRRVALTHLGDE